MPRSIHRSHDPSAPSDSTPPTVAAPSPLGAAVRDLHLAVRVRDPRAQNVALRRLYTQLSAFFGLWRARGARSSDEIAEVRQRFVVRLYNGLAHQPELREPFAFAWKTAEWAVRDFVRSERRARRLARASTDEAEAARFAVALEATGVHAPRAALSPRRGDALASSVCGVIDDERRLAAEPGMSASERRHVETWVRLRVEGFSATEVAVELGLGAKAAKGSTTVYKWAERGASVVERAALAL